MNKYTVTDIQDNASYLVLTLDPQSNSDRLQFWPGQYAAIGFRRGTQLSPMRCFSIVSSPYSEQLQFGMRKKGLFTRNIAGLTVGQAVQVQGPFGNFVLDPSDKNVVMLAAGIGITPFVSMLRAVVDSKATTPITLLYACRNASDIPFEADLRKISQQAPNVRLAFVVSEGADDPARQIYAGRIDGALLERVTNNRFQPYTFFVCGPSRFNTQMNRILKDHQVSDDRIVSEAFSQATKMTLRPGWMSIPVLTYALTGLVMLVGIGGVMAMDLIRYVPKVQASTSQTTATPTTANTATTNTATDTSTTATTPTTTATTPTTPTQTTTPTYNYQPPVSSAS